MQLKDDLINFNKQFVKTGLIDKNAGKTILRAFELKQESGYDDYIECTKNEVTKIYSETELFIAEVRKLLA